MNTTVCSSPDTPELVRRIVGLQEASALLELHADLLEEARKERERLWGDIQAIVAIVTAEAEKRRQRQKEWLGYAQDSLVKLEGLLGSLNHAENIEAFRSFLQDVGQYKAPTLVQSSRACRSLISDFVEAGGLGGSNIDSQLQDARGQRARNDAEVADCRATILRRQDTSSARADSLSSTSSTSSASSVGSELNGEGGSSVGPVESEEGALATGSVAVGAPAADLGEKTREELVVAIEKIIVSYLMTRNLYLTQKSLQANGWLNSYLTQCQGAKNGVAVRYNKARLKTLETLHNAAHDSDATVDKLRAAVKEAYDATVTDHAKNSFFKRRRSSLVDQLERAMKVAPIAVVQS